MWMSDDMLIYEHDNYVMVTHPEMLFDVEVYIQCGNTQGGEGWGLLGTQLMTMIKKLKDM